MGRRSRRGSDESVRALAAVPQSPQLALSLPGVLSPQLGRVISKPSVYRWNPYEGFTDLPFERVVSILKSAESGDTERWADLTRRMLSSDDHLCSVYETRINGVAGSKWKLTPGESKPELADLAKRAADDCERVLKALPGFRRSMRDLLDGVGVGWSIAEIIWEQRGDEWVPADLIWIHPRRFRFDEFFTPYLWDDGLAGIDASERGQPMSTRVGASGMALTANKYIVHIPRVLPNYPTSSGLLLACVRPWWTKLWAQKFQLSGAELAGNPRYMATAPQSAPANVFEELLDNLNQLSADGVAAFREGTQVQVQAPLAQGAGGVWDSIRMHCDAAFSKTILGSTLNVEIGSGGGNRAAAESQSDMTITPRITADSVSLWETLSRDLLRPYLVFNRHRYGGIVPPIPLGEMVLHEPRAEIDELLVRTGAVTLNELRQSRNLEPISQGGDALLPADISQPAIAPQPVSLPDIDIGGDAGLVEQAPVEKAADTALNGAQVTSLLEIVARVARGEIPRDTGIGLITAAFPINREKAELIMGSVGAGFVPTVEGDAPIPAATEEAPAARPLRDRPWDLALKTLRQTT
jgi:phage gp29-like protein